MSLSTLRVPYNDPSIERFGTSLYVINSRIPNAGLGLFTFQKIKKGKIICEYFGDIVFPEDLHNIPRKHYIVTDDNGNIINGINEEGDILCAAAYINDPLDDIAANCDFHWVGNRCYIKANQDIPPNGELLIPYGKNYWFS
jgi:hypothetical protein